VKIKITQSSKWNPHHVTRTIQQETPQQPIKSATCQTLQADTLDLQNDSQDGNTQILNLLAETILQPPTGHHMSAITEIRDHRKNILDPQRETIAGVNDILKAQKETPDPVKKPKRLKNIQSILITIKTKPETRKQISDIRRKIPDHSKIAAPYHPTGNLILQQENQDHLNDIKSFHMFHSRNKHRAEEAMHLKQEIKLNTKTTTNHLQDTHNQIVDIPILVPDLQNQAPDQKTNNITQDHMVSNPEIKLVVYGSPEHMPQNVWKVIQEMTDIVRDHPDAILILQIITRIIQGGILNPNQELPHLSE
jgi:hypothetical protein